MISTLGTTCGDENQLQLEHFYSFDNGYIVANNRAVKIKGVRITYDVSVGTSKTVFDLASMVRAVVKDVRTGKMQFIKANL